MQISDELLKLVSDLEIAVFNGAPRPAIVGSFGRLRAALSALSLPVQPVAWIDPAQLDVLAKTKTSVLPYLSWKQSPAYPQPLYTTPPVPPTKGQEDDLIAAREAAEDIEINYVVCDPKEVREQVAAAIMDALRKDRAIRSPRLRHCR